MPGARRDATQLRATQAGDAGSCSSYARIRARVHRAGRPSPRRATLAALAARVAAHRQRTARAPHASPLAPPPTDPTAPCDAPALPATTDKPADAAAVEQGHEPGRDVKTPTVNEVEKVREDKQLGSPFGFAFMIGGSFVHGGAATVDRRAAIA